MASGSEPWGESPNLRANLESKLRGSDRFAKSSDFFCEADGDPSGYELLRGESPDLIGLDNPVRCVNSFMAGGFGDIVTLGVLILFPFTPLIRRVQERV